MAGKKVVSKLVKKSRPVVKPALPRVSVPAKTVPTPGRVPRGAHNPTAARAARGAVVTVDDSILQLWLADSRVLSAAPSLAPHAKAMMDTPKICGRCPNKRQNHRGRVLRAARAALLALPEAHRTALKQALGIKGYKLTISTEKGTGSREF